MSLQIFSNSISQSQARGLEESRRGNGWMFSSLDSPRAFLYTEHAMSWVEAEDFCQMIYGHLATGETIQSQPTSFLFMFRWFSRIFTRISETEKHLRSCLDWTSSIQASDSVHLDVSWKLCSILLSLFQIIIFRNDFDWSEVSLAPGDGWGEYVEEYESSLCVSLDIDHGYRWDTRWVGNCNVVIADIVRFIWDFPPFQILPGSNGYRISLSNWA